MVWQLWSGITRASPDRSEEAIAGKKWLLEIYDGSRRNFLISRHEFDDFSSLRMKIVENRACRFLIVPPDGATSEEFQSLLDLRGLGFDVERK